jgi:hypothetical protein
MRDYARIENDIVVELISLDDSADITTLYHPDLIWIEVTGVAGVALGWVVVGGTVQPPPPPPPPTKDELTAYSAKQRYATASFNVTIAGLLFYSDPVARNTLANAHDYAVANPGYVADWKLADGTFAQLDEAALNNATQQMATFVQECFTCESTNLAAINAGTMTTTAEIDAAYAAISTTRP